MTKAMPASQQVMPGGCQPIGVVVRCRYGSDGDVVIVAALASGVDSGGGDCIVVMNAIKVGPRLVIVVDGVAVGVVIGYWARTWLIVDFLAGGEKRGL